MVTLTTFERWRALLVWLLCASLGALFALPEGDDAAPHAGLRWGKHVLPDASWQISVAFALSQLIAAAVVVPLLPVLPRVLAALRQRLIPASAQREEADVVSRLCAALDAQSRALPEIFELAVHGVRARGRAAELALRSAQQALQTLLMGAVRVLPRTEAGSCLGRFALASLQLSRALEAALRAAEHLTESRVIEHERGHEAPPLAAASVASLQQMHGLLREGLDSLRLALAHPDALDADDSRAREIEMNLLEAEARRTLLEALLADDARHETLALLALSDAYEVAGNQLFRMADILEQGGRSANLEASATPTSTLLAARER